MLAGVEVLERCFGDAQCTFHLVAFGRRLRIPSSVKDTVKIVSSRHQYCQ